MRSVIALSLVAVLVFLLGVFVLSSRELNWPNQSDRHTEGEILAMAGLQAGQQIVLVIGTHDSRRNDMSVRTFQVAGGKIPRFGFKSSAAAQEASVDDAFTWHPLTDSEAYGLDVYLQLLRRESGRNDDRYREVLVGHYRDGKRVGQERLGDPHSELDIIFDQWGQVREFEEEVGPIPLSILRQVIPPWILAQRLEQRERVRQAESRESVR